MGVNDEKGKMRRRRIEYEMRRIFDKIRSDEDGEISRQSGEFQAKLRSKLLRRSLRNKLMSQRNGSN